MSFLVVARPRGAWSMDEVVYLPATSSKESKEIAAFWRGKKYHVTVYQEL